MQRIFGRSGAPRGRPDLRPEPSLSAARLFCLQPGAAVILLEPGDEWSRIRTRHGMEGWSVSRGLEAIP